MRDDFSSGTKDTLAKRVAYRCSNPACGRVTTGPQLVDHKSVNIGVAAHIHAAAEGGKRYNPLQTAGERSSIENGIWLCQNCAKLIDSDEAGYSVELLQGWKKSFEAKASLDIHASVLSTGVESGMGAFFNRKSSAAFANRVPGRMTLDPSDEDAVRRHQMKAFYRPSFTIYDKAIQTSEVTVIKLLNEGYLAKNFSAVVPWVGGITGKLIINGPNDDKLDTDELLTVTLIANLMRPVVPIHVVVSFLDVTGRRYQQEYRKLGPQEEITRPQLLPQPEKSVS